MALLSKLCCFLLFLSLVLAYDLSERRLLNGELGVELHYDFARFRPEGREDDNSASYKSRNWVYSSHLTFKDDVSSITDGQLRSIAHNAFDEMKQVMVKYGLTVKDDPTTAAPAQTPQVMAILAFGKEIILSSAQRGRDTFAVRWAHSPVRKAIERCQASFRQAQPGLSDRHKNGASCGEVMVTEFYYHIYPDTDPTNLPLFARDARILAVEPSDDKKGYIDKLPCPGNKKDGTPVAEFWGCREFVAEFRLRVVPEGKAEDYESIDNLAGGLVSKDQVPLQCTVKP
ncbi:hypothetical protein PG987_006026 [Apiospora arundinis]